MKRHVFMSMKKSGLSGKTMNNYKRRNVDADTTPLLGTGKMRSRPNKSEHKPSLVRTAGAIAPICRGLSPGRAWVCRSHNCVRMRFSSIGRITLADTCCGASLMTAIGEVGSRLLEPLKPPEMIVKVLRKCRNNGQWWRDRNPADEFLSFGIDGQAKR